MTTFFRIHPGIGVARVGNAENVSGATDPGFYLAPEQIGALPIKCDSEGKEVGSPGDPTRITEFKLEDADKNPSQVKRQGARFKVFAYKDEKDKEGHEIKVGEEYLFAMDDKSVIGRRVLKGKVTDIEWTVHLANKKSSWYDFKETEGMHGYAPTHPLRNANIDQADQRRQLIIDPGPVTASYTGNNGKDRTKTFDKGANPGYPQTFPPEDIKPYPIDTLGEIMVNEQDDHIRLVVLGGKGNAGSTVLTSLDGKTSGSPYPVITSYANNDGWFDDVSDGPVAARIQFSYEEKDYVFKTDKDGNPILGPDGKPEVDHKKTTTKTMTGYQEVQVPAWCIVGYPRYAPQIEDVITLDEAVYDVFVRNFAYEPAIFGVAPFTGEENEPKNEDELELWRARAQFNPNYYPKFYEEIWPILQRPETYLNTFEFFGFDGGDPHNTGTGGNLDEEAMSMPPKEGKDIYRYKRQFIYSILRKPGQENQYMSDPLYDPNVPIDSNYRPRLMPLACGDNPLSNTAPQKFLRLTDTQLFLLKQWADGKFVNECLEWDTNCCDKDGSDSGKDDCKNPFAKPPTTGRALDRGALANALGGAFCPGGEVSWNVLNPAVWREPYRVKHAQYQAAALSLPAVVETTGSYSLANGMEPGDLTKFMGLPWQADFHACNNQPLNITYEEWNLIYPDSIGDPVEQVVADKIPWWPAHRPYFIPGGYWASGIPNNDAGSLSMVSNWNNLGFLVNPDGKGYVQVERNDAAVGPMKAEGDLVLGVTEQVNVKVKRSDT